MEYAKNRFRTAFRPWYSVLFPSVFAVRFYAAKTSGGLYISSVPTSSGLRARIHPRPYGRGVLPEI
ncbi:MAG: hypothetical protein A2847_02040 [Candidatus Sungbacteria bacterium RIFCSPHIGHO2_01_FULL_50_25]|uniref:Uncharacterized protein n=1 Tax=Candidatus Sungbacteria bacterium RIFCSPHIGHO2_01_FULL_50_25 TaxID=1802265 RepID=A0A1G2KBL5_9BACT|nr:MAG: hypothetical protein A2847_02040 [Candidatus Sungbacteria bacterium RIFCSPHIGHO2_01_FULL_50_25]